MTATQRPANMRNPIHLLAFGLGSGLARKAPGTFGTLAAIPVWWLFLQDLPLWLYSSMLVITFVVGVWLCDRTSRDMGVHDHGGIVWDEWVGLWLTYWLLPSGWFWILLGFVLFRFFDIIKPWPIRWLDRHVHGGFGIMIDDVLAGLFALTGVQLSYALWLML